MQSVNTLVGLLQYVYSTWKYLYLYVVRSDSNSVFMTGGNTQQSITMPYS